MIRLWVLLVLAVVTGCTHANRMSPSSVSGTLSRVGGPSPGAAVPVGGDVLFTSDAGVIKVTSSDDGTFTAKLSPGTYVVTGKGAGGDCGRSKFVVLGDGASRELQVSCLVP